MFFPNQHVGQSDFLGLPRKHTVTHSLGRPLNAFCSDQVNKNMSRVGQWPPYCKAYSLYPFEDDPT